MSSTRNSQRPIKRSSSFKTDAQKDECCNSWNSLRILLTATENAVLAILSPQNLTSQLSWLQELHLTTRPHRVPASWQGRQCIWDAGHGWRWQSLAARHPGCSSPALQGEFASLVICWQGWYECSTPTSTASLVSFGWARGRMHEKLCMEALLDDGFCYPEACIHSTTIIVNFQ